MNKVGAQLTLQTVIVFLLLVILTVSVLLFGGEAFGKERSIVMDDLKELEANKKFLKPWGDLTDDTKKELTKNNFTLALKKMLDEIDKKISDARSLAQKDDLSSANNLLNSAEARVKEVIGAIDKKREEEKDEFNLKYVSEKEKAKQYQIQIGSLKKEYASKTSLKKVLDDIESGKLTGEDAISELEKNLAGNTGTIDSAKIRVEIFFNKYTDSNAGNVKNFRDEQMDGITSSLTKAEIEYAIGLIYEDERSGLDRSVISLYAEPQFRDVFRTYLDEIPFAPEAAYKVAKYETDKKKQFSLLKVWWEKYHEKKYIGGNYELIEEDILSFVKKGYSEYDIYMELHGFVWEFDLFNNNDCAEFCSYFGEPFTDPKKRNVDCLDSISATPLTMTCEQYPEKNEQRGYKEVTFDISTGRYKHSDPPSFSVTNCEYGPKVDGINGGYVAGVYDKAPVWMEFKVVDKLTNEEVCNTYSGKNSLSYKTVDSFKNVANEYGIFPTSGNCEAIIFAMYAGKAGSRLFEGTGVFDNNDKNNVEKASAKVYFPICDAYHSGS